MSIHLTKCDDCPTQFRVKKLNKPYIGMYKDKPVFHWNYVCPVCNHVHTVRFYNQSVNSYFDKLRSLEFSLWIDRKEPDKYEKLLVEYEIAKDQLNIEMEKVSRCLHLKI